jgi:hypothetical protein
MAGFILWCGVAWVLRGGWFGAIVREYLRVEPGTTITRLACALMIAVPLGIAHGAGWVWIGATWLSIYVSMVFGYFGSSMGIERGLRDIALMSLWGTTVAAIALSGSALCGLVWFYLADCLDAYWHYILPSYKFALVGALAGPIYAINKPFGKRWGWDWTERSEAMTGAAIGAALWMANDLNFLT